MKELNEQQQEELKIFNKTFSQIKQKGIQTKDILNYDVIQSELDMYVLDAVAQFNNDENGNASPDMYLNNEKSIGLEIFETSLYSKRKKKSFINVSKIKSSLNAERKALEKSKSGDGVYSYGDEDVNQMIAQRNYCQNYVDMKANTTHLIERHMKTYPSNIEKRGLLITLTEYMAVSHCENPISIDGGKLFNYNQDSYNLFREADITKILTELKVDFALFLNGDYVYFWSSKIVYNSYNESFQPFYLKHRIGVEINSDNRF